MKIFILFALLALAPLLLANNELIINITQYINSNLFKNYDLDNIPLFPRTVVQFSNTTMNTTAEKPVYNFISSLFSATPIPPSEEQPIFIVYKNDDIELASVEATYDNIVKAIEEHQSASKYQVFIDRQNYTWFFKTNENFHNNNLFLAIYIFYLLLIWMYVGFIV